MWVGVGRQVLGLECLSAMCFARQGVERRAKACLARSYRARCAASCRAVASELPAACALAGSSARSGPRPWRDSWLLRPWHRGSRAAASRAASTPSGITKRVVCPGRRQCRQFRRARAHRVVSKACRKSADRCSTSTGVVIEASLPREHGVLCSVGAGEFLQAKRSRASPVNGASLINKSFASTRRAASHILTERNVRGRGVASLHAPTITPVIREVEARPTLLPNTTAQVSGEVFGASARTWSQVVRARTFAVARRSFAASSLAAWSRRKNCAFATRTRKPCVAEYCANDNRSS